MVKVGQNLVWNASLNVPLLRLLTATSSNLGTDTPFDVSPHPRSSVFSPGKQWLKGL